MSSPNFVGLSYLGGFLVAEESAAATYATPVSATNAIPINSESFQVAEGFVLTGGINNSPFRKVSQPGRRVVTGGINMDPDGTNIGLFLKWANRTNGTGAGADVANTVYAPPPTSGASANATGSLDSGVYSYKVGHAYQETTGSGTRTYLGAVTPSIAFTGNGSIGANISWTQAASVPSGFSILGSCVFRGFAGNGTGNEELLATVTGNTSFFVDAGTINGNGSVALGTSLIPANITEHSYTGTNLEQKTFTCEVITNAGSGPANSTGFSHQFSGCKVNTISFTVPGNGFVTCSVEMHGQDEAIIASSSPSYTLTRPFFGSDAVVFLQPKNTADAIVATLEHFQITLANNLSPRYSLNGLRTARAIRELRRKVSGSFTLAFEDFVQYQNVLNDTDMAMRVLIYGPPSDYNLGGTGVPFIATIGSQKVHAWPFMLQFDLPALSYTTAKANLNTDQQIMQDVPFEAWFPDESFGIDASKQYDCLMSVWNSAATYADVP